jgi:hydroxyacylglutathione hydrolase
MKAKELVPQTGTRKYKAQRLIGELYRVAGEFETDPWSANAYLFGGERPLLVDCGNVFGLEQLGINLDEIKYPLESINAIAATHCHWDHVSALAGIRQLTDKPNFFVHNYDRGAVETGDQEKTFAGIYYDHRLTLPISAQFPPVKVDAEIRDGMVFDTGLYQVEAVHTPSHTPGSVSFFANVEGLKLAVVGDVAWGGYDWRKKVFDLGEKEGSLVEFVEQWQKTLTRLSQKDFNGFYQGHLTDFYKKEVLEELQYRFGAQASFFFELPRRLKTVASNQIELSV